jgi:hypothetical protein
MNHCCGRQKKQEGRSFCSPLPPSYYSLFTILYSLFTIHSPIAPRFLLHLFKESIMITDEIKQVVKSRYGKFAEAGSPKESR